MTLHDLFPLLSLLLTPIGGVIGWFVGHRERKTRNIVNNSDAIQKMQATINLLVDRNNELHEKVIALTKKNEEMRRTLNELSSAMHLNTKQT